MSELGTMYTGCRERITELVRPLDAGAAARTAVPACPEWSVHDLLAHLVGSADDVLARRLDGSPGQAWTAAQVEARRNRPIGDLLAEWEVLGRSIQELIDATASRGPLDFHGHDLRGALRLPGARDSAAAAVALRFYAHNRIDAAAELGVSLRVGVPDGREFGDARATVTVTGESFELLRALAGRRSAAQLRKLAWTGDADSVIPAFERPGVLRPPSHPIEE
jgi:uncharacterized protein (TIGR03083 family)